MICEKKTQIGTSGISDNCLFKKRKSSNSQYEYLNQVLCGRVNQALRRTLYLKSKLNGNTIELTINENEHTTDNHQSNTQFSKTNNFTIC